MKSKCEIVLYDVRQQESPVRYMLHGKMHFDWKLVILFGMLTRFCQTVYDNFMLHEEVKPSRGYADQVLVKVYLSQLFSNGVYTPSTGSMTGRANSLFGMIPQVFLVNT